MRFAAYAGVALLGLAQHAVGAPADDAKWKLVGDGQRVQVFMNMDSVHQAANGDSRHVRAWSRYVLRKPEDMMQGRIVTSYVVLNEYDCDERSVRPLQATFYDPTGTWITSSGPQAPHYPQPDSVGETELETACAAAGTAEKR